MAKHLPLIFKLGFIFANLAPASLWWWNKTIRNLISSMLRKKSSNMYLVIFSFIFFFSNQRDQTAWCYSSLIRSTQRIFTHCRCLDSKMKKEIKKKNNIPDSFNEAFDRRRSLDWLISQSKHLRDHGKKKNRLNRELNVLKTSLRNTVKP